MSWYPEHISQLVCHDLLLLATLKVYLSCYRMTFSRKKCLKLPISAGKHCIDGSMHIRKIYRSRTSPHFKPVLARNEGEPQLPEGNFVVAHLHPTIHDTSNPDKTETHSKQSRNLHLISSTLIRISRGTNKIHYFLQFLKEHHYFSKIKNSYSLSMVKEILI